MVARSIKQEVRKNDFVGRYGDEEILVIAPETCTEKSKALAQRLHGAGGKASIFLENNNKLSVTVSIGVAFFSETQNTIHTLIK